ncbi:MAG TPA: hypothetical protein VEC12_05680 [Bacteroidia bacterium]|nr:hypothetical protein [Bacteroidia bacterium]
MKRFLLILIIITAAPAAFSQKPEQIYSFARTRKPLSYYKEQAVLWKNEVDKEPKNANAWYNYYRVNRNLLFNDTTDERPYDERRKSVGMLLDDMEKSIRGTYEYHYCRLAHEGLGKDYTKHLEKTIELGEGRTEHLDYVAIWGELERNMERRHEYSRKLFDAGLISAGMMYYNYNVIGGLKQNAILLTEGDNDTYPLWVLQGQGTRRDVTVINLSLLGIEDYRDKIFKELGVGKWETDTDESKNAAQFRTEIVKHIAANQKKYPVYVGLTVNPGYSEGIKENLYLTGLALEYNNQSIDNIALLKRNFEQVYALDYIDKPFYHDISPDMVSHINCNYIVPMLKLFDHYKTAGDTQEMEWIKSKLLVVAKEGNKEQEVKKHIGL